MSQECQHCGAPREAGLASCRFCRTPFVRDAHSQAIPCPKCSAINEWGVQRCVVCSTWVVVQCAFCAAISPHHVPACLRCREPFAGAAERLHARQQEVERRRNLETASAVGSVAATFLGALIGAAIDD